MKTAITHRPYGAGGGGGATDPYWGSVVALLKFDGTNGATTYTDSAGVAHTFTNNSASISTAYKKFGSGSLNVETSGCIYCTHEDFKIGTSDFTLEGWFYFISNAGTDRGLFHLGPTSAPAQKGFGVAGVLSTGNYTTLGCTKVNSWANGFGSPLSLNAWHHVAVTRQAGVCRMFADGNLLTTWTDWNDWGSDTLMLGSEYSLSYPLRGYIDSFRFTNGVARYTDAFTPPTEEFPTAAAAGDAYTSVLMHFDGDWVDQKGSTPVVGSSALLAGSSRFGKGSAYFNAVTASTSYVKVPPYNGNLNFGSGDFTIEFQLFVSSLNTRMVLSMGNYGVENHMTFDMASGAPQLWFNPTGNTAGGQGMATFTSNPVVNQWNHIAIVKASGVFKVYINGTSVGTYTDAVGPWNTSLGLFIGSVAHTTPNYNGVFGIDELRVSKTARYTANFTPPVGAFAPNGVSAAPHYDPLKDYVKVLCHLDNTGYDIKAHTVSGSPTFSTNGKFGGYSLSAYYDLATSSDLGVGLGDFTIEVQFYFTATVSSWLFWTSTSGNGFDLCYNGSAFILYLTSSYTFTSPGISLNTWHHLAVVRDGTKARMYLDGVQIGTEQTLTATSISNTALRVGSQFNNNYGIDSNKLMDELRITLGCRYYGNFAPPMQPFQSTLCETDPSFSYVKVLMHFDDNLTDVKGHSTTGNAMYSAGRYGKGMVAVNPATIAAHTDLNMGTGDFTVEAWIRFNFTVAGYADRIFCIGLNGVAGAIALVLNTSNQARVDVGASTVITGTTNLGDDLWHHVAVTRQGASMKLWVDGTQQGSTVTDSTNLTSSTGLEICGDSSLGSTALFGGYIDDFRITKGLARYTSAFTRPQAPFPNS